MLKRIFSAFLIICLIFATTFLPSQTVKAYEPTGIEISAKAALLVSLDTGEVIYEKNADEKVYPASITKIMTALLMLESDKFDPDAKIAMSEEALKLISGTGSSVSLLQAGEEFTQLDLLYMILMSSYGDCSLLAATYYGGSVEGFVDMMNVRAKELGLTNTSYENPIGLHHETNYTTARDTYILTKYALQNDTFKEICESARYTFSSSISGERTLTTTNMLQDRNTNYFYSPAHGVKTGYTDEAGRCLVSTAEKNGYRYMCLVFGCPPTEKKHFTESIALYEWAFSTFELKNVADTSAPVAEISVDLSTDTDNLSLYLEQGVKAILPKDDDGSTIKIVTHLDVTKTEAPVKKGQVFGTADIIYAEKVLGTVNLISNENIEKSSMLSAVDKSLSFFEFLWRYIKLILLVILAIVAVYIVWVVLLNKKKRKKRKIRYVPYREKRERKDK